MYTPSYRVQWSGQEWRAQVVWAFGCVTECGLYAMEYLATNAVREELARFGHRLVDARRM